MVNHSFDVTTLSVGVGALCSPPPRHYSGPFREAQTEILSLSQTNWSETIYLSIVSSANIDLM